MAAPFSGGILGSIQGNGPGCCIAAITLMNYGDLTTSYGRSEADAATAALTLRLAALLPGAYLQDVSHGQINLAVSVWGRSDSDLTKAMADLIDTVVVDTVSQPISTGLREVVLDCAVHHDLLIGFDPHRVPKLAFEALREASSETKAADSMTAKPTYDAVGEMASTLFEDIERGLVVLTWRRVVDALGNQPPLMFHAEMMYLDSFGLLMPIESVMPLLPKSRLSGTFDNIVCRTVAKVIGDKNVAVSVKVSCAGLSNIDQWDKLITKISENAGISGNMVFNLDCEDEEFDMPSVCRFVEAARSCDSLIALNSFSIGSTLKLAMAVKPDIINIDPRILYYRRSICFNVIDIAKTIAPIVVADGVSSFDQQNMLIEMGVHWQGGPLQGKNSMVRPWHV